MAGKAYYPTEGIAPGPNPVHKKPDPHQDSDPPNPPAYTPYKRDENKDGGPPSYIPPKADKPAVIR